jgi:hypothetical protein
VKARFNLKEHGVSTASLDCNVVMKMSNELKKEVPR